MMKLPTMSCNVQMEVCTEQVEWAKAEKRTFLRQRIEGAPGQSVPQHEGLQLSIGTHQQAPD